MAEAPSAPAEPGKAPAPRSSRGADGYANPAMHPAARTRISGIWIGIIVAALVLVLLLVFILQNTKPVKIAYFTANGHVPLGVALTLSSVGGVLLAGVVASLRIVQIRRRLGNGPWADVGATSVAATTADEAVPVAGDARLGSDRSIETEGAP